MDSIAATATNMKAAEMATNYTMAVTKKVMDTQEVMAQEILEMLPDPALVKGDYIDTYA